MSDLPLMAGLYDIHGRRGVYYEVRVNKMEGVVAIGMFFVSSVYLITLTNAVRIHGCHQLNDNF